MTLSNVRARPIYNNNAAYSLAGVALVIAGPANDGPVNVPTPLSQPEQASSIFGGGPLVFWAAKAIASKRLPVIAVRIAATAASAFGTPTRTTGHGSSAVTVAVTSDTEVNATVEVLVHTGGTIGTAGITLQVSTDGGRNFTAPAALGTATHLGVDLEATAPLTLDFGVGTLVSGELITVTASVIAQGSYATIDVSEYPGGTNTAVASVTSATYPDDDYEIGIRFVTGGALGTAGITYQLTTSNGGLNDDEWGQTTALGTDLAIVIPGTGGASVTLGTTAETIGADSIIRLRTYAPNFNTGSIQTALAALFRTKLPWEICAICGTVDASMALAIDAVFAANFESTVNGEKAWIANTRMPHANETDQAYFTAMQTVAATGRHCYFGSVCYGDAKVTSALTGFLHKRPAALPFALEQASVTPNVDVARTDRPALGVVLSDSLGNPDCHDEEILTGPADYGFVTLIDWPDDGVYVNDPLIFEPSGALRMPHRLIWNIHTRVVKNYLRKKLSVDLYADADGHIREADAVALEKGANDAANAALAGWISAQQVTVSRTDMLVGVKTPTVSVSARIQSKIYPKQFEYTTQLVAKIAQQGR
jgi:hypothetical protein